MGGEKSNKLPFFIAALLNLSTIAVLRQHKLNEKLMFLSRIWNYPFHLMQKYYLSAYSVLINYLYLRFIIHSWYSPSWH